MNPLIQLFLTGVYGFSGALADPSQILLTQLKNNSISITKAASSVTSPHLNVYFVWATWCNLCVPAYSKLSDFSNDATLKNQIHWIGYSVDSDLTPAVRQEAAQMGGFEQNFASRNKINIPIELSRLPAVIVEDVTAGKTITSYTGYSNERYHYLKKELLRAVSPEKTQDDNISMQ